MFLKLTQNKTCCVVLCCVVLCCVILCYVMLCYVMLCYVMLCYVDRRELNLPSKVRAHAHIAILLIIDGKIFILRCIGLLILSTRETNYHVDLKGQNPRSWCKY